ncbi:MAG: hypothetical protein ACQ5SW_08435 [Sphaerochaetaceae bacterium]
MDLTTLKLGTKEYDPNDEVGIRGVLTNQYGVSNDDIGWTNNADEQGGTISIKGQDFMNIGEDQLKNGSSYSSAGSLADAIKNYESTYGYDFNANSDPTSRAYTSPYSDNINALYQKVMNYEYDPDSDPTYQAYEEQYEAAGEKAMEDTLGAASSLTGGRLNSYAQNAAQSQYNSYMSELSAMIPELASQGLENLYNQYNLVNSMDTTAYNRFADERSYDTSVMEYNNTLDYQTERDAISDSRYDTEWQYQLDRDAVEDDRYDAEWAYKLYQDTLSNSSGSSGMSEGEITVNYNALMKTFQGKGMDTNMAISYLGNNYDSLVDEYGVEAVDRAIMKFDGQTNQQSSGTDNTYTYDEMFSSMLNDLSGLSPEEALTEIRANQGAVANDLGPDGLENLMSYYTDLSDRDREIAADDLSNAETQKAKEAEQSGALYELKTYYSAADPIVAYEEIQARKAEYEYELGPAGYQSLLNEYAAKAAEVEEYNNSSWLDKQLYKMYNGMMSK